MRRIVLASSSPYRKALLERLRLGFEWVSPQINENRVPGESAGAMVTRLARLKAESLRPQFADALIIGADQCAVADGSILGKPGSFERAMAQLKQASGNTVEFHTGLCLVDSVSGKTQLDGVVFKVHFRELSEATIYNYLEKDNPMDCAGSFKSEGMGIALFRRLEGDDPSALIGLPLIRLVSMLEAAGVRVV
jgi:septum formation protein